MAKHSVCFITLENAVINGSFYLSTHMLHESLMGAIHTFILPSLLTDGKNLPLMPFARHIVHYMHNTFVFNDSGDREHLPSLSTLDGARNFFAPAAITISLNVFDDRMYLLPHDFSSSKQDLACLRRCHDTFDFNAIPLVEHYHMCYTCGLAFDLIHWVFENYSFSTIDFNSDNVDGYSSIFIPFIVHIG